MSSSKSIVKIPAADTGKESTIHKYSDDNAHTILLSQNINKVCLASQDENGLKTQLISLNQLGKNVCDLLPFCFHQCLALTELDALSSQLTSIGECCFKDCTNLSSMAFPTTLLEMGNECFSGCLNLEKCNLCSLISHIGDYAFQNCTKLTYLALKVASISAFGDNSLKNSNVSAIFLQNFSAEEIVNETTAFTRTKCFGIGRDCIIQSSDGCAFKYRNDINTLYQRGIYFTVSFNKNQTQATGEMPDTTVENGDTWLCPGFGYSAADYIPVGYNSMADGSGVSYLPGNTYECPTGNMMLHVIWQKKISNRFAVMASYSNNSAQDAMNGVEVNRLSNMISNQFGSITRLLGENATASNIIDAIKTCIANEKCKYLFIYLFGHGARTSSSTSSSGKVTQIGFYNNTKLRGDELWDAVKSASCKIFIFIHTCHSGHFFKSVNPFAETEANADDIYAADFISDARSFFGNGNSSETPKLLLWSSNKADEYGWMVNSSDKTKNPVWYNTYNMVGSGLGVSFYNNYDADKTYETIWNAMNRADEPARQNEYVVRKLKNVTAKELEGPTPQRDVYGGFDESEKIFTI